jgi:hypothetical protein
VLYTLYRFTTKNVAIVSFDPIASLGGKCKYCYLSLIVSHAPKNIPIKNPRERDISTNKVTTNTIHLGNNVTPIEK